MRARSEPAAEIDFADLVVIEVKGGQLAEGDLQRLYGDPQRWREELVLLKTQAESAIGCDRDAVIEDKARLRGSEHAEELARCMEEHARRRRARKRFVLAVEERLVETKRLLRARSEDDLDR